jgi:hypothetical protein
MTAHVLRTIRGPQYGSADDIVRDVPLFRAAVVPRSRSLDHRPRLQAPVRGKSTALTSIPQLEEWFNL